MTAQRNSGRQWVYPMSVKGRFQRIHRYTGFLLQAFLFLTPWVNVSGRPAVQIDIPARRVFALGGVYTASDAIFLVLGLLIAVFSLFLFTALWGRLWCGYACPQTVFLEEWIRPIEKWIEGDRGLRMARDKQPWLWKNLWRRIAKWAAFAGVAGLVAMTTVSWFAGARELWTGNGSAAAYGMVGIVGAVLFADFAWFREQFCNYLCPYARFQGALSDDGSLTISYAVELGEPRGEEGACIDCKKCVAVCPQGIDIREGFQLECIACGRCIDACEGVMGKRGQPGLILYRPIKPLPNIRPRTVAYGAILTGLSVALVAAVATHHELQASVARAPGTLFVVDPDGWTRNTYLVKVTNSSLEPMEATVKVEDLPEDAEMNAPVVKVEPTKSTTVPVIVRMKAPPAPITHIRFEVESEHAEVEVPATFTAEGV